MISSVCHFRTHPSKSTLPRASPLCSCNRKLPPRSGTVAETELCELRYSGCSAAAARNAQNQRNELPIVFARDWSLRHPEALHHESARVRHMDCCSTGRAGAIGNRTEMPYMSTAECILGDCIQFDDSRGGCTKGDLSE